MVLYYLHNISNKLSEYNFPIKEGDMCILLDGFLVKMVYINSKVEADSSFRDFRFIDTKSMRGHRFPRTNTILCAPYGKGKAIGDKELISLLISECIRSRSRLAIYLYEALDILDGKLDYWDLALLRRLTRDEKIEIAFETPTEEYRDNNSPKIFYLHNAKNIGFHAEELGLNVGDYCFCRMLNSVVLIQINKEIQILDDVESFRWIESITVPEILLPFETTIIYDYQTAKEDLFLFRLDRLVKQPVSKSILFCARNRLPLSEDTKAEDYQDKEYEDGIISDNKYMQHLLLEILETIEKKMDQRNYSILKDFIWGESKTVVAKKNNLSPERVRQLYKKSLEEVKSILISEAQENELLRKENIRQNAQARLYVEEIERLKLAIKEARLDEESNKTLRISIQVAEILNTPIQKLPLSIRAINILNSLEIATLGEIPKIQEATILLRVRNSGKKTMEEIQKLLDSYGLQFGMPYSKMVSTLTKKLSAKRK